MSTRNRTPSSGLSKNPPSKPTSKFELPALSVGGFGSLTDGTDIPPPEREPTPPPYIHPANVPLPPSSSASQVNGNGVGNGTASATDRKPSQISIAGTDQTGTRPGTPEGMLSPVMSPTSPNRPPSSMKRFLSRKSMNGDYNSSANGRNGSKDHTNSSPAHTSQAHPPSRPESSLSFVSQGGTKTKKKRSWWQKLMGKEEKEEVSNGGKGGVNGANGTPMARKRTSTVLEQQEPKEQPRKKGPPPPTLPQLRGVSREGKADGSFGGDDMFSNIK